MNQVENLIRIYEKYRHVFSEVPGKIKNYQCKIQFKEPVEFHKKSYPIAYSLKEAVRAEINRMINNDIIEYSQSPFTSPIVAIHKKNGHCLLYTSTINGRIEQVNETINQKVDKNDEERKQEIANTNERLSLIHI